MESLESVHHLLYSVPSLGFDESKGPPSFVFVTHQLVLDEIPYQFPEDAGFFITNSWLGPSGSNQQNIRILGPSGRLWLETENRSLELEDPDIPYMVVTFFKGVKFAEAGVYRVEILLNDSLKSSYPFHVKLVSGDDS